MNAPVDPTKLERTAALQGLGDSRLRKEDARFIQGKGNYVDDIKLPGMVHMDIVRSPYAHARIKKIDKTEALKVPGVIAVLTADDLKPLKLHWMPTLAGDVQAVLADEKVHFQMQEVAVVLAEDRYAAADGVEAVQVEYEELPVVMDPYEALKPGAPVLREDLAGKTSGAHGAREHPQPHLHLGRWRQGGDRRRLRRRAGDGEGARLLPPRASLPAGNLRLRRQLRPGARRARHLHHFAGAARGAYRGVAVVGHSRKQGAHRQPRHRRRLRQQGAHLPGLRVRHRVEHRAGQAGEVGRGPHREHFFHRFCAGLPYGRRACRHKGRQDHRSSRERGGRPRRLRCLRRPHQVPGRPVPYLLGLVRHPGRVRQRQGRIHQQGTGRRGVPLAASASRKPCT